MFKYQTKTTYMKEGLLWFVGYMVTVIIKAKVKVLGTLLLYSGV